MESNSKNYFYLKNNQKLSQYISQTLESYIKNTQLKILPLAPIFIREDNSLLINFFTNLNSNYLYIVFISLTNTSENKYKEIKIELKNEKNFIFKDIILSNNKKHLIILNENKNKAYIIPNFIEHLIIEKNDVIELKENNYFEVEKGKIINIKFNNEENDENIIIYGIYTDLNILYIFNNKYINKNFEIFFEKSLTDFQIIKKNKNNYDLFLFDIKGNIRYIKNIENAENIPKSDQSNFIINIDIYDKILTNINDINNINEYKKFYIQKYHIINNIYIAPLIRTTDNILDISILFNDKIFIIKKYNLNEGDEEKIDKILPINNEPNKLLIKSNKNVYLLDIPSLSIFFLFLSSKEKKNNTNDILLILKEIISKINLNLLLKLPSQSQDLFNFAINFNFYNSNILCIKNKYPNMILKIYELDLENNNNKNINIIENNNKNIDDINMLMNELLLTLKQEKEIFISNEIIKNKKEEYYIKILEEIYSNINSNEINNNVNNSIELMKKWYINAFSNIKLYGNIIKDKYIFINNNIKKNQAFSEKIKKNDDIIINLKKNIENKFKIIEKNEKEIIQIKKEIFELINNLYMNNNNINEEKNVTDELIKKMNNHILKNIKNVENNLINNNNELFNTINFDQMKNFPLTMKYLDEAQKEKINYLIDSINNLINTFKNFHEQIKK